MEPLHISKKVCRPRLNRDELYEVYRLVNEEYWIYRRRGSKMPHFFLLRRLQKKLRKILESMGYENLE